MDAFEGLWFQCEDGDEGTTAKEQEVIEKLHNDWLINDEDEIRLLRSAHCKYLTGGLGVLPAGFVSLDASRPWILYWILHALYLLDKEPVHLYARVITTLRSMQSRPLHLWEEDGQKDSWGRGYGGGPNQLSHGAPTYAAVLALCTVGSGEAFGSVDRSNIYRFFLRAKDTCGGFRIHQDGEVDSRSTYTVLAVARILNILTPELVSGCASYLLSCQTYEGGFGGEPGNEAHGGYNFCTLAGLLILNAANQCDIDAQEGWLLRRQVKLEGGFQGRTNKLVDSCYSFWQGAALALVNIVRCGGGDTFDMDQHVHAHQNLRPQPEVPSPMSDINNTRGAAAAAGMSSSDSSVGLSEGESVGATREGNGNDMQEHEELCHPLSVPIPTSSDWEIGEVSVQDLLSQPIKQYTSFEGLKGKENKCDSVDTVVKEAKTSAVKGSVGGNAAAAQYCESCVEEGVVESQQIAAVQDTSGALSFNQKALQRYILHCGQQLDGGGLRDKPGKGRDYYHSCYALSGLAISQSTNIQPYVTSPGSHGSVGLPQVYGDVDNLLRPTSAVFNIGLDKLSAALFYFSKYPPAHTDILNAS